MIKKITSTSNSIIKNLVHLQKTSERKEQNLIVIEGRREIILASEAGFAMETLFFCPSLISDSELRSIEEKIKNKFECIELSEEVFKKLTYRNESGGVLATAKPHFLTLDELNLSRNPLILVLETVEKPGNLGAILRTADAAKVDAVLVCDNQTDLFNANVIRSSIGCVFTNQVVNCSSEEAIKWLKKNQISIVTTYLEATDFYHQKDLSKAIAIVMGSEAFGVSKKWQNEAKMLVKIPMLGKIDSINVSTATAVMIFEAMRQRNFNIL